MKLYLIGSLRNPAIPTVAATLRTAGYHVHDDWYAAGPAADDCWQRYSEERGQSYQEALHGVAAQHVFNTDRNHLNTCDAGVLVYPAGRSAHLELGYVVGQGKPGFILLDKIPERWDVMAAFATVCATVQELLDSLARM